MILKPVTYIGETINKVKVINNIQMTIIYLNEILFHKKRQFG
jgi:hypothetical protein